MSDMGWVKMNIFEEVEHVKKSSTLSSDEVQRSKRKNGSITRPLTVMRKKTRQVDIEIDGKKKELLK